MLLRFVTKATFQYFMLTHCAATSLLHVINAIKCDTLKDKRYTTKAQVNTRRRRTEECGAKDHSSKANKIGSTWRYDVHNHGHKVKNNLNFYVGERTQQENNFY